MPQQEGVMILELVGVELILIPYTLLSGSVRDNVLDAIRWQISKLLSRNCALKHFFILDEYCERWLEAAVASVWALS